ncbi:MAG: dinitrogenase iron-molybdenum cofactor [Candidatus Hydrothermota bacterium]|uniref:Dinitrogenase iron-molybdenum cofactor n=1 Tax=candidate division WOR-3 bacterium TaxID=2052148 RepID=A0A7C1BEY4_UNCW3|nr:MAG: dinitrogenase iron-molybdenum cofactor [Candidatus Hydrothermae bacterium]HDM90614.1 dinitrogenase iron-molybdenum cofactor [candidate division WOR-3 bacterium]
MRIAFTADEPKGLDSVISYHFGRCPYFVIVELDGRDVKKIENIENPSAESHAVGELPQLMNQLGVNIIVTGGMGPKAQEYFAQFGIQPITGAYGKVRDVLEEIIEGTLRETPAVSEERPSHVEGENEEIRRLKLEVRELRREVAELKSLIKEIMRGR